MLEVRLTILDQSGLFNLPTQSYSCFNIQEIGVAQLFPELNQFSENAAEGSVKVRVDIDIKNKGISLLTLYDYLS